MKASRWFLSDFCAKACGAMRRAAAKKLTAPAAPIARFDILRETLLSMRRILPVVTRVVWCFAGLIAARLPMQQGYGYRCFATRYDYRHVQAASTGWKALSTDRWTSGAIHYWSFGCMMDL